MSEDNDSTCSEVVCEINGDGTEDGEGEVADVVVADANRAGDETRGEDEEEDSSDDFFDAGEGAVPCRRPPLLTRNLGKRTKRGQHRRRPCRSRNTSATSAGGSTTHIPENAN